MFTQTTKVNTMTTLLLLVISDLGQRGSVLQDVASHKLRNLLKALFVPITEMQMTELQGLAEHGFSEAEFDSDSRGVNAVVINGLCSRHIKCLVLDFSLSILAHFFIDDMHHRKPCYSAGTSMCQQDLNN